MTRLLQSAPAVLLALSIFASPSPAGITTFDYIQTDIATGSGIIAAPAPSIVGGVTITWLDTPMPQATVRDPAGAGSAGGAVGGFDTAAGSNGDNGEEVALFWDANGDILADKDPVTVDIMGTGSDGNPYILPIDLVFFGENGSEDHCFMNLTKNVVTQHHRLLHRIRCLEQLWLDAPGGLPTLKDNENRAETLPKNVRFEKLKKCVFRDPQPKTNKNRLPEFNPQ